MTDFTILQNLPFQILDLLVILIIFLSSIFAYSRGFVHEILAVVGWIGAILATFYGLPVIRPFAQGLFDSAQESAPYEMALNFGVGFIIFISTIIFLSFLSRAVSKQIQKSILSSLDRALGFLFGALRGCLFICLTYILFEFFTDTTIKPQWLTAAKSSKLIIPAAEMLKSTIPENIEFLDPIRATSRKVKKNTQDILDTNKVINSIISPQPTGKINMDEGSYGQKERQDMERLIDTNQLNAK